MYDAENYNRFDAIKANVTAIMFEDDDLEIANLLERIYKDIELAREVFMETEEEKKGYRLRAYKAEMKLKKYENEES